MFFYDLDHEYVKEEYKTCLKEAENERLALQIIRSQPSSPSPLSRLLITIANALIAAGTRLRDFACAEPGEPASETARL